MTRLKFQVLILFLSSIISNGQAQTAKVIDDLAIKHQECLDSGIDMLGCSKRFYFQMDSMLNVVYNKLRSKLNSTEKATLKKEQLDWLNKRDIYFKKQQKIFKENYDKGEWGSDMAMVTYDDEAEFVKDRVLILTHRLHN